ncbi:hypothetical protein [Galactobacter caseinivorans]|uniref:Type II secretion system protein GspF domain-containing protein n=1 Tax=Galactobacter caseinivorans TaxID=2676123 RepID=A0A496PLC5_9MICC|nr:hypothetical protein [Galactobacter caseinivorans]RKW71325.1 hypothetical protein DWQ67_00200 [Galactobacter caseinivorans]
MSAAVLFAALAALGAAGCAAAWGPDLGGGLRWGRRSAQRRGQRILVAGEHKLSANPADPSNLADLADQSLSRDPLPEEVAREVLGRLVALLQAGVPRAASWELLWRGCQSAAQENPGTAPQLLPWRRGAVKTQGQRSQLMGQWARALAEVALADAAGEEAWSLAGSGPGRAWRDLMWAVGLSSASGAPLAELVGRVADDCSARADAARARISGLAAATSTRRILMWLPAGGLLLAQLLGADPLGVLVTTPAGRIAALLGALFWLVALAWSRRIMRAGRQP